MNMLKKLQLATNKLAIIKEYNRLSLQICVFTKNVHIHIKILDVINCIAYFTISPPASYPLLFPILFSY